MRICPKCSREVSDGSKICRVCGSILNDAPAPPPPEPPAPPPPPAEQPLPVEFHAPPQTLTDTDRNPGPVPPCSACGEPGEPGFDLCWNCGTPADGAEPLDEATQAELAAAAAAARAEVAAEPDEQNDAAPHPNRLPRSTHCPDCQTPMRPVVLIDNSGQDSSHEQLTYATPGAKRRWFFGRYSDTGKVEATLCPSCGRIVLHAAPPER